MKFRGTGDGEKEEEGGVDLLVACWILVLVGFGDMYTRVARLARHSSVPPVTARLRHYDASSSGADAGRALRFSRYRPEVPFEVSVFRVSEMLDSHIEIEIEKASEAILDSRQLVHKEIRRTTAGA